jgi:hypothetical protein
MPIPVVCPGCKVRFNVSDKFAGKKGPCPKCKVIIQIPAVAPEEIKIHAPQEFAGGGLDKQGRPVLKPLARQEAKFNLKTVAAIVGSATVVLLLCLAVRGVEDKTPLVVIGLALVSPPLAVAGYSILRDQELGGYKGREMWVRAAICGTVYAVLWGLYAALPSAIFTGEAYEWLFLAPLVISIGAGAAFSTFDLDFGTAALHYCFFLLVTLLLRSAIALPPIWTSAASLAAPS